MACSTAYMDRPVLPECEEGRDTYVFCGSDEYFRLRGASRCSTGKVYRIQDSPMIKEGIGNLKINPFKM